ALDFPLSRILTPAGALPRLRPAGGALRLQQTAHEGERLIPVPHVPRALRVLDRGEEAADARAFRQAERGHYVASGEEPERMHYTRILNRTHNEAVHIPDVRAPRRALEAGTACGRRIGEREEQQGLGGVAEIAEEARERAPRRRFADGSELARAQVLFDEERDPTRFALGEAIPAHELRGHLGAELGVAEEADAAVGLAGARLRLGDVVQQAGEAQQRRARVLGADFPGEVVA